MKRHVLSAIVGGVVATVLAGGIAWATIPATDGVIHGCYQQNAGNLRVIDAASEGCRASEIAIAWNQVGPQGLQGAPGAKGDKGDPGEDGTDGTNGVSVTATEEGPGDACATGGVRLTAVNGTSYVCNGLRGQTGAPGLTFRGPWQAQSYNNSDVVTHNGSSWYGVEFPGPTDVPGSSPAHWILVAEKGATGPQGSPGVSGFVTHIETIQAHPGGGVGHFVSCPTGKMPLSGGFDTHGRATIVASELGRITTNVVNGQAVSTGEWLYMFDTDQTTAQNVTVQVVCATIQN